jgi:hypothetical protein
VVIATVDEGAIAEEVLHIHVALKLRGEGALVLVNKGPRLLL